MAESIKQKEMYLLIIPVIHNFFLKKNVCKRNLEFFIQSMEEMDRRMDGRGYNIIRPFRHIKMKYMYSYNKVPSNYHLSLDKIIATGKFSIDNSKLYPLPHMPILGSSNSAANKDMM